MTFKESFESAKNWIKELRENSNVVDAVIALVGNKSDLIGDA
jgi:GTPase SAR1 family protein